MLKLNLTYAIEKAIYQWTIHSAKIFHILWILPVSVHII